MNKKGKIILAVIVIGSFIILNFLQFNKIRHLNNIIEDNEIKSSTTFWYILNNENKGIDSVKALKELSNVNGSKDKDEVLILLSRAKANLEEWQ